MNGSKQKAFRAYTNKNSVKLVHGGREYFDTLRQLIEGAKYTVHLQCYIFNNDETGQSVIDSLCLAAQKGIKVFFLNDGYASPALSETFVEQLNNAGVKFSSYEPLFKSKSFYFGRRLHHKVVVADGYYAIVGGMNIADRYNDMPGIPAWLDYAIVIEGEAAFELEKLCCDYWNFSTSGKKVMACTVDHNILDRIPVDKRFTVRVRRNDWVKRKNQIWKSYLELFNRSNESITIVCSYFLPGWIYRRQMARAVKRGVRLRVVVAGPSDVMLAKYAERYLYKWMFKNGIELYEYQKTVLHAKVATCDGRWLTIGSYNVNNISAYASIELNIDVRNRPFVQQVDEEFEKLIAMDCICITEENYKLSTNAFKYLLHKSSYLFIKFVLFLFTFYFEQEE